VPLRFNHSLKLAAMGHAREMVAERRFTHTEPSGETIVQRILQTGYVPAAAHFKLGENLGWGNGDDSTPRRLVGYWMDSPAHRRNILRPFFREIGIAIIPGAPVGGAGGASTYDIAFGAIRP